MSVGIAILGLAVLILIHEAGHFFAALAVGMRPRKFYLGFGPPIVKTTRGGVEYGIGSIPLGGYVKIPGMHRPAPGDLRKSLKPADQEALREPLEALDAALERGDEAAARDQLPKLESRLADNRMFSELEGSLASDAYWRQKAWKRVVVIAAGPFVNILCAILLFVGVFMVGSVQATRGVHAVTGHPAIAAGLKAGDRILTIAGHRITPNTLAKRINATHGRPFEIAVVRGGKRLVLGPVRARHDPDGVYRIGIEIQTVPGPGDSLPGAAWRSVRLVGVVTRATVSGISELFVGHGTRNISSSVGIVRVTAQAYRTSLQDFFFFIGYISLAIALLNLLPVLPLDGGHIVMSLLERARGRAFSQLAYLRYSAVGITFFMFLLYLGLRNDFQSIFSGGS